MKRDWMRRDWVRGITTKTKCSIKTTTKRNTVQQK